MTRTLKTTKKMKRIALYGLMMMALVVIGGDVMAAGGPPPTPSGIPIDGVSGILVMIGAALFGKKYFDKKKQG